MKLVHHLLFVIVLLFLFLFTGCGTSNVIATIGPEKVTLEEYEDSFAKNNGGWGVGVTATPEERKRFLDLYLKFRLKLTEANARNLRHDTAVVSEIENYRVSVAQSYMIEKEIIEPNVKMLYNRKLEEVRASHILISVARDAAPADTLVAYQKAMGVINRIGKKPFDSLAIMYSEDPTAQSNKGDLGYFTTGRMVPEFEDAVYALKVGESTRLPIRTQFGYHVIQLTDRHPNPGSIRISHIMKKFGPSMKDSAAVRDTIWSIYRQIRHGLAFSQAAYNFSDDLQSAMRDGDIGFLERSRLPTDLGITLFNTPLDSVTQPIRLNFGWDIFRVSQRKPVGSFEELEKDIKALYQQQRYQTDYVNYLHELKKRYNLNYDVATLYKLTHAFDTTKTVADSGWSGSLAPSFLGSPLLTCGQTKLTVGDVVTRVQSSQEFAAYKLTPSGVEKMMDRLSEIVTVEEHARHADARHPGFAELMREYEDGILLYRVEQDEIWKKFVVNDSLLRIHYDSTMQKYKWPNRSNFSEIYATTDSAIQAAYWRLLYGEDFLQVAKEHTMRAGYREKFGIWGIQGIGTNQLYLMAWNMKQDSVTPPFKYESGWSIIKSLAVDSARTKTFSEAGAELVSSYQETASRVADERWLDALRKQYPVVLHTELLDEAFKKKRP